MRNVFWTEQSRSDLAAIHAFIAQDSPDLDIDLAVDSLTHPEQYPLVSQAQPKRSQPTKAHRRVVKKVANRPRARS